MVGIFQPSCKRRGTVPFHNQCPMTLSPPASIYHCLPLEGHRYHPKITQKHIVSAISRTINERVKLRSINRDLSKSIADGAKIAHV